MLRVVVFTFGLLVGTATVFYARPDACHGRRMVFGNFSDACLRVTPGGLVHTGDPCPHECDGHLAAGATGRRLAATATEVVIANAISEDSTRVGRVFNRDYEMSVRSYHTDSGEGASSPQPLSPSPPACVQSCAANWWCDTNHYCLDSTGLVTCQSFCTNAITSTLTCASCVNKMCTSFQCTDITSNATLRNECYNSQTTLQWCKTNAPFIACPYQCGLALCTDCS